MYIIFEGSLYFGFYIPLNLSPPKLSIINRKSTLKYSKDSNQIEKFMLTFRMKLSCIIIKKRISKMVIRTPKRMVIDRPVMQTK